MPLIAQQPPEDFRIAAARHLVGAATPEGGVPSLRQVRPEALSLIAPHRTFSLGLSSVLSHHLEPEETGWRFLITDGERTVASAEVANDEGKSSLVNGGPYVGATVEAITRLEGMPELGDAAYELRLLKIPALYIVAAWLVDAHRLIMPLAPAPSYLEPGAAYDEESFLAALQEAAHSVAQSDDGLSGG
jgi:hypothetical protein